MAPNTTLPAGTPEPGTRLSVTIERPAALGRGVARVDGLTLLVARGVPGERVTVEVERTFPRYALARVVSVEQPAMARVEPPCPHFAACGGCDWQHVDYPAQLGIKRAVLAEQLERIGRLEPPAEWALVPAEKRLAYRDKLEFTPVPVGDRYAPGYHDADGHTVLPIEHCRLAPERHTRLVQGLLDALLAVGALPPPGDPGPQPVQRIAVQGTEHPHPTDGAPSLALLIHLRAVGGQSEGRLRRAWPRLAREALGPLREAFPELTAVALQFPAHLGGPEPGRRGRRRGPAGPRRSGPSVDVLLGPRRLTKRVNGRAYRVPHTAFFQVHPEMAGTLAAHVVEQVGAALEQAPESAARPVFDLYGGVGLFAMPLLERGLTVVGVDSDREGLRAAEETAADLGLAGGTFQRADLERPGAVEKLVAEHGAPGVVLCDPPRRGLSAALCEALVAAAPPHIVYVSCDGGTFARDAGRLADAYELVTLRGFDLFPQTHHLEVVGTFRRRATP